MAFEGIIANDAQKEDMAVSLAVLLIKDAGKEVTVSSPGPALVPMWPQSFNRCPVTPSGVLGASVWRGIRSLGPT